jgi:hypothetical protein
VRQALAEEASPKPIPVSQAAAAPGTA